MKLPLRIFSDLHLGHGASRIRDVQNLRPLFRGAGTVVFNGDTWEELSTEWRARSEEMLGQLHGILQEEGCDVLFLPGNHDPSWEGEGFLELAGGRIVISHGDSLLREGAPWKREMLAGKDIVASLWAACPEAATDPVARHELARMIAKRLPNQAHPKGRTIFSRALDAACPPQRAIAMLHTWATQGPLGARFCERYFPAAELLVTGHFHCHGIRNSRGKTVINTGSFVVPGPAGWVEWSGETLAAGRIREKAGAVEMSQAKLIRTFI